ncbi:MAG: nucleotide sugar dehydrogenase [Propionibacteriaceae bacterium]
MPTVGIVGMGYVGLPTALSFMDAGRKVIGVDVSRLRLAQIQRGDVDLLDRDRDRLRGHLEADALALAESGEALRDAVAVVVCVPTPVDANLVPDLKPLRAACRVVVENAVPGQLIVLTSTTYVGCTRELVVEPLMARGFTPGVDIHVVFSPERIDPGVASHRPEDTPRVIGGVTKACLQRGLDLLEPTCKHLFTVSSPEAAEMTKLLENTFRAVNIALVNEFADASRALGVDVMEVIGAAATKPYGFMRFNPGPGVGGHCIPCDPHYLLWQLKSERRDSPVIDAAMKAIAARPSKVTTRITELLADLGVPPRQARVHVVGVTFKPGVADLRESPSLDILEWLLRRCLRVTYTDSYVPEIVLAGHQLTSRDDVPPGTDLVVVLTVHPDSDVVGLQEFPTVLDASYRMAAEGVVRV